MFAIYAIFSKTVYTLFHLVHEKCFSFTFGPNEHSKLDFAIRWKNVNISTIFFLISVRNKILVEVNRDSMECVQ